MHYRESEGYSLDQDVDRKSPEGTKPLLATLDRGEFYRALSHRILELTYDGYSVVLFDGQPKAWSDGM